MKSEGVRPADTELRDVSRARAEAISRWVRDGGTQTATGAFCGWRELPGDKLSAPYPEITGYVLNFLAQLPLTTAEAARANAACVWLVARVEADDFSARPDKFGTAVYTFDVAMVAHGLITYGCAVGDEHAVTAGLRNAELLVAQFARHGELPCVVPDTISAPLPATWSTRGRAHLLKSAQGLLSAAEHGLAGARAVADRLVLTELDRWNGTPATFAATSQYGDVISLHAMCYAAEGLWVWGVYNDDAKAIRRSREITHWVWRQRFPNGGFPGFVHVQGGPVTAQRQSDVLAQAVRLAVLHHLPRSDLDRATSHLLGDMWLDDKRAALYYRPRSDELHLNCWASLFAIQALKLHSGAQKTLQWSELV